MIARTSPLSRKAGPVHIREWPGPGPRILLAHGMAAHTHWWDSVIAQLGDAHIAAFDFRGHGESDWVEDGVYTAATWMDDIETARQALGWDRFVLVGHSMGARISLEYAVHRYPRLSGVAAIDFLPEVRPDKPSRFTRIRGLGQPVYPSADQAAARFRLEPDGTQLSQSELRVLGAYGVRPFKEGFSWKFDWRALSHYKIEPVWAQLPQVKTPALLVRGELSTIISREDFNRAGQLMLDSRLLEIPGAHHHVPLDAPRELGRALTQFSVDAGR